VTASGAVGHVLRTVLVGAVLVVPGVARGQTAPATAPPVQADAAAQAHARAQARARARYQIFVMEAVLQRAVDHGAEILSERIRRVMPNMIVLAGMAQARGFRLPDYGVFFDVEVPALRRSIAWSFQMLDRPDPTLAEALAALKRHVKAIGDSSMRRSLEEALQQVELQMGPMLPPEGAAVPGTPVPGEPVARQARALTAASSATVTAASTAPAAPAAVPPALSTRETAAQAALLQDPEGAYLNEVKKSLIEAMLDYGGPLALRPDEWLTVAARDDEDPARLSPDDAFDVRSMTLRIRGRDLEAFRTGRISREEAIKRIEVREY